MSDEATSANGGGTDTSGQKSAVVASNPGGSGGGGGGAAAEGNAKAGSESTSKIELTPEALSKRLEEERARTTKKALKELGFDDLEAAKKAFADAKKLADEKLSADERREKQIKELEPKALRAEQLEARLKKDVETRFSKLPEAVQQRIDAEADGDWEKRDAFMRVLGDLPTAAATTTQAAKPPLTNTTKAPPAPKSTEAKTPFEEWQALKAQSPMAADIFYMRNQFAIDRSTPSE